MKSFSKWTILEVDEEFQVEQQKSSNPLQAWLDHDEALSQTEAETLLELQSNLIDHVYDWNEHELQFKFIAQLLLLVKFDQKEYQSFLERIISAPYKNDTISGDVDFIVAQGRRAPQKPHFFLHEHKKDVNFSGDPLGQLLIAMIAAQILNDDQYPVYGAYVVGRAWHFVVLEGKQYAVSLAYDATKDEIRDIFCILKNVKEIIDERVRKND